MHPTALTIRSNLFKPLCASNSNALFEQLNFLIRVAFLMFQYSLGGYHMIPLHLLNSRNQRLRNTEMRSLLQLRNIILVSNSHHTT